MNSQEISRVLSENRITQNVFQGVYAADTLPAKFEKLPAAVVINTDPAKDSGQHWVSLFQDIIGPAEFFDSFGNTPDFYSIQLPFLQNGFVVQDLKIQSDLSTVCGQYCMFFIYHKCLGRSFSDIVKLFSTNKMANDHMVCEFINREFSLKKPIMDIGFLLNE